MEPDVLTGAEEDDSDYYSGSDMSSYATSLATGVKNHLYENGRRYNGYRAKHWAPNDEKQADTMDLLHHSFSLAMQGELHLAPIGSNPQKILDLGTGTGIYAIDIGDMYPSAKVIGSDLSPIQPAWVPPNVQFEVDDFTLPWEHTPASFDFIHARCLYGSVPDWVKLYKEAFGALKPGGFFEAAEVGILPLTDDNTLPNPSHTKRGAELSIEACHKLGNQIQVVDDLKGWMEQAGFVDIVEKSFKIPLNPWPKDPKLKEIGRFMLVGMCEGMEGFVTALYTGVLGWTVDDVQKFLKEYLTEMKNRKNHIYFPFKVVYGRKPEA